LTYVLWAISPEGRPVNIGEVLVGDNHRSKLEVTTDLQAFALIVTAEPYYAVRRPSNVVILENEIRSDTEGSSQAVDANFELIDRGGYIPTGYKIDPVILNARLPLEFFEARNALRIAEAAGSKRYATESYEKAVRQMNEADAMASENHENRKSLISISREAVQTAEDAREISVKHIDEERAESERRAGEGREASSRARANEASQRALTAEIGTADATRQRDEADRKNADAQKAAREAAGAQADAERDRNDAQRKQHAAEDDSDRNRAAAASSDAQLQQAVTDREELRARLLQQFNLILETRDTARGLVVNMSDVLFDSGKYTLPRSHARSSPRFPVSCSLIRPSSWPSKATPTASAPRISTRSSLRNAQKASAAISHSKAFRNLPPPRRASARPGPSHRTTLPKAASRIAASN